MSQHGGQPAGLREKRLIVYPVERRFVNRPAVSVRPPVVLINQCSGFDSENRSVIGVGKKPCEGSTRQPKNPIGTGVFGRFRRRRDKPVTNTMSRRGRRVISIDPPSQWPCMTKKTCTCEGRSADPLTLYTVSDVANILGFSEKTVRRRISRREIGTIRPAGSLRMTRRHLEAWQNLNDVPAITDTAGRAA